MSYPDSSEQIMPDFANPASSKQPYDSIDTGFENTITYQTPQVVRTEGIAQPEISTYNYQNNRGPVPDFTNPIMSKQVSSPTETS